MAEVEAGAGYLMISGMLGTAITLILYGLARDAATALLPACWRGFHGLRFSRP